MTANNTATDEATPKAHPKRDFALAYLFWVVVFASIVVSIWLSSSELSAFRYAGF